MLFSKFEDSNFEGDSSGGDNDDDEDEDECEDDDDRESNENEEAIEDTETRIDETTDFKNILDEVNFHIKPSNSKIKPVYLIFF